MWQQTITGKTGGQRRLLVGVILYGNVADGSWYFQLIQNKTNVSDMLELLVFW